MFLICAVNGYVSRVPHPNLWLVKRRHAKWEGAIGFILETWGYVVCLAWRVL